MDYQIIIDAYEAYYRMWVNYQRGFEDVTSELLKDWWLKTVGNVQRFDMPQHARQEHFGHSRDEDKVRWHKNSRFLHEPPVFGWVIYSKNTHYGNNNDYNHLYNDELGKDFAYFRDNDNVLYCNSHINDVSEEIATLKAYFEKCRQYQLESTENLRLALQAVAPIRRHSK